MAGILDFLFGSDTLKKAAGPSDSTNTPDKPAGIDIAKMAQDQADKSKPVGAPYPKTPLSSTMTPQTNNGKKAGNQ